MRTNFEEGVELTSEDLNRISSRLERQFYDRMLLKFLQEKSDRFFDTGFACVYDSATVVTVTAGLGIQYKADAGTEEPLTRVLYLEEDASASISSPHATFNRKDIICVRADRDDTETGSRKVQDLSDVITTETVTVETDWSATVLVVTGTASGSPVVPSTPSGYIKIAEVLVTAVTGVVDQSSITDMRTLVAYGPGMLIDSSAFTRLTAGSETRLSTLLVDIDSRFEKDRAYISDASGWTGTEVTASYDVSSYLHSGTKARNMIWAFQDVSGNNYAQMQGCVIDFPTDDHTVRVTFGADFPPASGTYFLVGR